MTSNNNIDASNDYSAARVFSGGNLVDGFTAGLYITRRACKLVRVIQRQQRASLKAVRKRQIYDFRMHFLKIF